MRSSSRPGGDGRARASAEHLHPSLLAQHPYSPSSPIPSLLVRQLAHPPRANYGPLPAGVEPPPAHLAQRVSQERRVRTGKAAADVGHHAVADHRRGVLHVRVPEVHQVRLRLRHVLPRLDPLLHLLQPPPLVCLVVAVVVPLDRAVRERHAPALTVVEAVQPARQQALLGGRLQDWRDRAADPGPADPYRGRLRLRYRGRLRLRKHDRDPLSLCRDERARARPVVKVG